MRATQASTATEAPLVLVEKREGIGILTLNNPAKRNVLSRPMLDALSEGIARFREALRKTGGDAEKAEALMRLAVDALASSEYHAGSNDRSKRYDSWEKNLFPSLEKFEWWLERAQSL